MKLEHRQWFPAVYSLIWAVLAIAVLCMVIAYSPSIVVAFVAWVGGVMTPRMIRYWRGDDRHV